jgi:isopenicillin N synthase-like dioxygenase
MDEQLNPNQVCGDTKEGYYIETEDIDSSIIDQSRNIWPNIVDFDNEKWRQIMLGYSRKLRLVAQKLLRLVAIAAGIDPNEIENYFSAPTTLLRLLHYGSELSVPEKGIYAAGEHSDYGMLTLLATDSQPGLQIFHNNRWCEIDPIPDLLIVNLGDMLERWTNGSFKSTIHRVLNVTGNERYSIAYFYEPNADAVVECLPAFVSLDNPIKFSPVKYKDYLNYKYSITHKDYKLSNS